MGKVLVVDDAQFMRLTLSNILKKAGFEVVGEASDGQMAVDMYDQLKPDLVTMDITMPTMNGLDATREILKQDPNAKIVMCSAVGQQKIVVEAIQMGAKDFIVKPFDETRVVETIHRFIQK
ncbi:response regulator [Salirhabdus sp. Marseille-P4669]|uniref:response regulator n=1 Tax=Salirhabdus sp. Marseille-P4669 TaxID=2042310 RepID=UPI000C7D109A|nr:response regulator [Salirhabdus sp. Marseille-P4669]